MAMGPGGDPFLPYFLVLSRTIPIGWDPVKERGDSMSNVANSPEYLGSSRPHQENFGGIPHIDELAWFLLLLN